MSAKCLAQLLVIKEMFLAATLVGWFHDYNHYWMEVVIAFFSNEYD